MKNGDPIGQIRFCISDDVAVINYSIAPDKRGCGYGKTMMNLAKKKFHEEYQEVKTLIGQVKSGNYASSKCFEDCGFEKVFYQFELHYN